MGVVLWYKWVMSAKGTKAPTMIGNKFAEGNPNSGRPRLIEKEELEQLGIDMVEWAKAKALVGSEVEKPIPFFLGAFARERGLYSYNLRDYAKESTDESKVFSQLLNEARQIQLEYFAVNGITRKFDAVFTKYTLGNISDWTDKQTLAGDKENPLFAGVEITIRK